MFSKRYRLIDGCNISFHHFHSRLKATMEGWKGNDGQVDYNYSQFFSYQKTGELQAKRFDLSEHYVNKLLNQAFRLCTFSPLIVRKTTESLSVQPFNSLENQFRFYEICLSLSYFYTRFTDDSRRSISHNFP